jgi:hypothetical protein
MPLASARYFVGGDAAGSDVVDVIDRSHLSSQIDKDGRAPHFPRPIRQAPSAT